jgi:hypothetical protein
MDNIVDTDDCHIKIDSDQVKVTRVEYYIQVMGIADAPDIDTSDPMQ